MLTYLRIRDLALIEDVVVEPADGLVAFTGETGAGKSIILDGLALASGERATLDQVRAGADEAVIEAVFSLATRADLVELLESEGLDGGDELVVRRVLGRRASRAYINDRVVTVARLRQIGTRLVDIAGQHESQGLLAGSAQLELLDRAGGLAAERLEVASAWEAAVEAQRALDALLTDDRDRVQRADYLRFQLQEIRAAGLDPDEESELHSERQRLRHADELVRAAAAGVDALYEGDESAMACIGRATEALETIGRLDPESGLSADGIHEARFAIEEAARALQSYGEMLSADPARLEAVEQRLAVIEGLRRKYGDSVEQILRVAAAAEHELRSIDNRDDEIERLTAAARAAVRAYDGAASRLSAGREAAAGELAERISAELQHLGMDGARLSVQLRANARAAESGLPPGASRRGYESVEFHLAANPGEPPLPLNRVASGGELSRVMLALKLAETRDAPAQTLVFDEIDAGVGGGRVAERLAEQLGRLGESHQILVVTHLPQIAARATSQLKVSKSGGEGRSRVRIAFLDTEGRVEELARMLGDVEESAGLRQHARDLLGDRA